MYLYQLNMQPEFVAWLSLFLSCISLGFNIFTCLHAYFFCRSCCAVAWKICSRVPQSPIAVNTSSFSPPQLYVLRVRYLMTLHMRRISNFNPVCLSVSVFSFSPHQYVFLSQCSKRLQLTEYLFLILSNFSGMFFFTCI